MKKRILASVLAITLLFQLSGCSKENERYQAQFLELFDTVTTIIGYAKDKDTFSDYAQLIYDTLNEYHELYDIYNDYEGINNIKTINDNAGIAPVKVDQKIIDLLKFSKEAYDLSDGEVNVAFGAVLRIWHEYREDGIAYPDKAELPPMDLLKENAKYTDINKVIIDEKAGTVFLEDSKMKLDVGAIAKGYATEQVVRILSDKIINNVLLSVGGNVRAVGGRGEKGQAWNVGVQNPDIESKDQYLLITELENLSLVSSGDYERYYTVAGKEYHHIIDPETLMPATYFTAVSIICEDSGLADALSTITFNMPLEEGRKLIEALPDVEAMWVMKDGELIYSTGFESFIKKDNEAK